MVLPDRMRRAAGYNGAPVGERQALLSEGADTIEAMLEALQEAEDVIDALDKSGYSQSDVLATVRAAIALATQAQS